MRFYLFGFGRRGGSPVGRLILGVSGAPGSAGALLVLGGRACGVLALERRRVGLVYFAVGNAGILGSASAAGAGSSQGGSGFAGLGERLRWSARS